MENINDLFKYVQSENFQHLFSIWHKNNRESKILSQLFQAFEYAGGPVPVFSARPSARNRAHSRERPQAAAACRREITCSPSWHDSSIIFLQSNISSLSFAFPFVPSSTENPSIPHASTASSEASKCHWHAFHDNFASAERPRRASWVARWTCNNDGVALLPGASCGRWHGWMDVTLSSCSPECQEVAMHFSTCWMYISLVWLQGFEYACMLTCMLDPFLPSLCSSDKSCSTLISALPRLYVQLQGIAWWLFGSSDAEHAQETHCVFVSDEFILAPTKEECYVVKFPERYQFCFVGDWFASRVVKNMMLKSAFSFPQKFLRV